MDRLACVNVPELPLQLLCQIHSEWSGRPVAVVEQDRPQGTILWINEAARALSVLPGMSYAQGLSLAVELRGAKVSTQQIEHGLIQLTRTLRDFSPEVEVSREEPGVFWLNASGLTRLYPSASKWAQAIRGNLSGMGFRASVVVGFRRFGVYAAAKEPGEGIVFATPDQEDRAVRKVPLARLALDTRVRDTLERLGVVTVGDFVKLPVSSVRRRFGPDEERLHALATGRLPSPLAPEPYEEPLRRTIVLDTPDGNSIRLLFLVKSNLHPLLAELAGRAEALSSLEIRFALEGTGARIDRISPAEPTLEEAVVMDLLRLRLEAAPLPTKVAEMTLSPLGVRADGRQLRLFFENPKRDLDAGNRALARLRAELGPQAVVRARLGEAHLPEAGFSWEPLSHMSMPSPAKTSGRNLVRRIRSAPLPLKEKDLPRPDDIQPNEAPWGPYVVSGGWWRRVVERIYYFVETRNGEIQWVYYDRSRKKWFSQGRVE